MKQRVTDKAWQQPAVKFRAYAGLSATFKPLESRELPESATERVIEHLQALAGSRIIALAKSPAAKAKARVRIAGHMTAAKAKANAF